MTAASHIRLPRADGSLETHTLGPPTEWQRPTRTPTSRTAYAAAHVVADPLAENPPTDRAHLDWTHTLAFRRHLWSWGLGVAEAMDTAQRGMGLDWDTAAELIRRSTKEAHACGGAIACGAGTDHLTDDPPTIEGVIGAYQSQLAVVEEAGARPVVMGSAQLARIARSVDEFALVYRTVLGQLTRPAIVHWLGPAFNPQLAGYWGSHDLAEATTNFVAIVTELAAHIDGVKVSLLDAELERDLRTRLPGGVSVYTGDDFNYVDLIRGDDHGHSHALLGIFDAIAPAAATALRALDDGDEQAYEHALAKTVPLARHLFSAPTLYYKTGLAFLAWVAGHQPAFAMVGGLSSARGIVHLSQALRLADDAGLIPDPELAARRMRHLLAVAGIDG